MRCLGLLCLVLIVFGASQAKAQDDRIFTRGDAVVTGFSGTKSAVSGNSVDQTFIDPDGASAKILKLEPGAPPTGQLITAPPSLQLKARDVGQVFAIGLDQKLLPDGTEDTPDIYLGATSAFGLQIVAPDSNGDGKAERLKKGEATAEWMDGQFGKGGGPGSIYRVDGKTGAVSLFANIPGNNGPGLGDIAFDSATRQFFVSDLDTGLIYRLDASGTLIDSYDHGQTGRPAIGLPAVADDGIAMDIKSPAFDSEDSGTWGITQPERRVWGLGFRAGRLYYTAGPEIWSVSINLEGTFGSDPRREIEVSGTPNNNPISDIAFDAQDHMYVAQRGGIKGSYDYSGFADAKQSVVFRFAREIPDDPVTPGIWVPIPDEYAIGFPPDHRNTSGGVALGYGYDAGGAVRPGTCNMTLWATGDSLLSDGSPTQDAATQPSTVVHGLQGTDIALTRPDNEPPQKAWFVDYDGLGNDPQKQGHVGDVEIWQPCERGADSSGFDQASDVPPGYVPPGETPPEGVPPGGPPEWTYNLRLEKRSVPAACAAGGLGFLCDYIVRVTNMGPDAYVGPIVVNDQLPASPAGAVMTLANIPPWTCFAISPTEQQCTYGPGALLPGESVDLHVTVDLPVAAPVCFLYNEAELIWAWGQGDADPSDDFDPATATIPAPHCPPPAGGKTNLQITKHPLKDVCTDKIAFFECPYQITVRNMGADVYEGDIQIDDTIPAGATASFAPASWNCMGPPPTYSCQRGPVVLQPGQAVNMSAVVKVPKNLAGPLGCEAKNEVKIVAAAGGTDQNTDPTDDEADATMILPGEVDECPGVPKLSNLKLKKTGPDGECPVLWGNWICQFKVTVQNFGKPYTSPIQFIDALPFGNPAGAVATFLPPAGWTCGGPVIFPNLYQCSSDNPDLAHMEKVEIPVIVRIPVAPVAKCEVTNNAQIIKAPGGTLLNSFEGDDAGSAKAQLAAAVGQGLCLSNLKLTKSGPAGPCPVSGNNWECQFKVTLQNFGKAYKSQVQFIDALPFGTPPGATVSFQAPAGWNCGGPVLPNLYVCNSNNPNLDHGEKVEIPLTVRIPVAPTLKCDVKNNAKIIKAPGGSPNNFFKVDDEDSAEAQLAGVFPQGGGQGICLAANLHLDVISRNQLFGGSCPAKDGNWICHFGLKVTNIGEGPFEGDINITDALPLGSPAGATMTFEEQPGWDCGQGSSANLYQCATTNARLDKGESALIRGAIKIPFAPVEKCAITNNGKIVRLEGSELNALKGDDSASVSMPLQSDVVLPDGQVACSSKQSNLKLEKTAWVQNNNFCRVSGGSWVCDWKLTLTNTSSDSFTTPIEFVDQLVGPPPGASLSLSPPAGWTCQNPAALRAECRSENPDLGAGKSVEFAATARITVRPVSECVVKNYARISMPKAGTQLNVAWLDDMSSSSLQLAPYVPSDDPNSPGICLSSSTGEPELPLATPEGKKSNLTIAKTAAASQVTASGQSTKFTITVTNEGPGVFNAPIEVRDTLFDGAIVEPSNGNWSAPWVCEGQSAIGHPEQGICTHPPFKLDPGESAVLELEIEAPNSFIAPSGAQVKCGYENKVEILRPAPGSPKNADAGDDVASAEVKFAPFEMHGRKFCELGLTTPERPETNLTIAKTAAACTATAAGQKCPFAITVTNTGTNPYNGPIEIRDTLFDGAIVEPSSGSWSAPWSCEGQSAAGHPEQGICTHPPVKLDPGENVVLDLEIEAPNSFVAPSGSQVRCGYTNKVEILDPAGGSNGNKNAGDDAASVKAKFAPFEMHGKTFCTPPTNLTIAKAVDSCSTTTGGQNCRSTITVTNKGPNAYNGPVEIRDTLFDGATVEPSNGSWSAPWTCEGQSAAGHPEQGLCTHPPMKLDPGESVELKLEAEAPNSFVAPSGSQARCGYKNKAEILDPAGGSSTNTNAGDDQASAEAKFEPYELHGTAFCGPPTNLAIAKTAGACRTTTGGQNCPFTVTITNEGPKAYKGPIQLRDTLFDGQIVEPANGSWSPPWTCEGQSAAGHPEQGICTHPPVKLDPGKSVELKLEVEAPNSFVAPSASQAKCGYANKVEILDPTGGSNENTNAGDDTASVNAKFAPFEIHGTTFCGPPTNLAIAKTAGACDATTGGQNCPFTITVINKGMNAYKGPIKIRDTLFDGQNVEPSNGTWSAPWTCEGQSAAGHPEQGICTHPPVKLDPGDSVALNLQVEAPNSFVAPSGSQVKCSYTNKAEILDPVGGSDGNTSASDDAASVQAKFAPFEMHGAGFCGFVVTPPPAPTCPQGWSRTPIPGKCCPPRSGWDGERCKRDVNPPEETCPPNSVGDYPDCRCMSGYAGTPPNCRTIDVSEPCTGGMEKIDGDCRCPRGMRFIDGKCRTPSPSGPEKTCPGGMRGKYPDCRKIDCPANQRWIDGICRCPDALKWNGKRCVADAPKVCPSDSIGKYPNCRCKRGTTGTPGECEKIVPKKCPADSVGKYPNCRCKRGTAGEPGNCQRIVIEPKKCREGFRGTPPNCKRIIILEPRRVCPPGFRGTPPKCRRTGTNPP